MDAKNNIPVASAETPEEVQRKKEEELRRRVRQARTNVREHLGQIRASDPGVGIPRDKHYCWINMHPSRVSHYLALDYEICKDPRITTAYIRDDGTHIYNDSILMCCDMDYYEALKLESQSKAIEYVDGEGMFSSFANRVGIPVLTSK